MQDWSEQQNYNSWNEGREWQMSEAMDHKKNFFQDISMLLSEAKEM